MNIASLLERGHAVASDPAKLRRMASHVVASGALLVSLAVCCYVAWGDDAQAARELEQKLDKRGSIMLRDASLANWLFTIQEIWKVDIVFGNELQSETVNGAFVDRTLREVLNSILISRNYGYEPVGSSLIIKPLDQMGNLKPQFKDEIIPLKYLNPTEAEPSVRILLSPHGTVQSIPSSKSLYIVDLPDRITRVRKHLLVLEDNAREALEQQRAMQREEALQQRALERQDAQQQQTDSGEPTIEIEAEIARVFHPQYVQAEALLEPLQSVVGDGRVSVMTDDNKLLVIARESLVRTAEQVLQQVDLPRPQVRITALLYDVNVEEMERLGFNWSHAGRGRINASGDPQSLFELDNSNFALPSAGGATTGGGGTGVPGDTGTGGTVNTAVASALGGWLTLSHLSRHFDLTAVIQALNSIDGARLLARPNILATDGTEAEFSAVSEIPVQQLTETEAGGSIGTTEFREAGIKLTVTPAVKQDGTMQLQITPEFSVLAGFQAGQPIIDRRSATTVLQLRDGETVVIGGLLRRTEIENQRLLPGSRKWKHFARLFRDHETTITESELLVVVKADIIGPEHITLPREEAIQGVVQQTLENVPYATYGPFVPTCDDPYCPLHNPHYRDEYYSGDCAACSKGFGKSTPSFPAARGHEFGPAAPGHAIERGRALPPPVPISDDFTTGSSGARGPRRDHFGGPHNSVPPPVTIHETTQYRRSANYRTAMRRLPPVSNRSELADSRPLQPTDVRPVVHVDPFINAERKGPGSDGHYRAGHIGRLAPTTQWR